MTKQEFLNELRAALTGRVNAELITENLNYYEDYINTQIRMGAKEAEVIESLGSPRLIARSIIDANKRSGTEERAEATGYGGRYSGSYENSDEGTRYRSRRLPVWAVILIVFIVFLMIGALLLSVFSFLAPVIIPVILVMFIIRLSQNMYRRK